MADSIIAGKLTLDSSEANQSVKSIKTQLREATADLIRMQEEFGEFSAEAREAAARVADVRDRIDAARDLAQAFDPGNTMAGFTKALSTAAAGVSALTGAMALFGTESEDVEKTLLKVQAAMALSQGISELADLGAAFGQLKTTAITAFNAIKSAIGSTGIGLLVIALGAIYTYWDDIKEAVGGVNREQKDLLETTTKTSDAEKEKLKHMNDQDNILKLQGKSEKQILEMKVKQLDAAIAAGQAQLEAQKDIVKAQEETARRNHDILEGILTFLNAPLTLLLTAVDKVRQAFGQSSSLAKDMNDWMANLIFDPKKVKEDGDKAIKAIADSQTELMNQRAGFQLQLKELDKKALEQERSYQTELRKLKNEAANALIKDQELLAEKRLRQEYEEQQESIRQSERSAKQKNALLAALETKFNNEFMAMRLKRIDELDKKIAELQKEQELKRATEVSSYLDKSTSEFNNRLLNVFSFSQELRFAHLDAAGQQYVKDMQELAAWHEAKLKAVAGNEEATLALNEEFEKRKTQIADLQNAQRLALVSGMLGQAASLFEQNSVAYKAFATAQAIIDTYNAANAAYKAMAGIPVVGPALGAAAAGLAIVSGYANVRRIQAVRTDGSVPGGLAPASMPAPIITRMPQTTNTVLPQKQINEISNATVRAFVLESDVTNSQERIQRLNRAARLGD